MGGALKKARRLVSAGALDTAGLPDRMSAADYRTLLAGTPCRRPRRNLLICADGRPSEEAEQRDFASYMSTLVLLWSLQGQRLVWTHNPAGGKRSAGEGGKLKAAGYRKGVPDAFIFNSPPSRPEAKGLAIELKRRHTGRASSEQKQWLLDLDGCGWITAVCHGAEEAIALINQLGYADQASAQHHPKGEAK